jgi:hypothetical protein
MMPMVTLSKPIPLLMTGTTVEMFTRFKAWDSRAGDMVPPRAKSTAARIARVGGEIILGTAEWVSPSSVDAEGRVKEANDGFHMQVFNQPKIG